MVGRLLAQRGFNLINGGLRGTMEAAARGYRQARESLPAEMHGLVIGILPGASAADANPYVDIAIATGMAEARNYILINSADAVIAVGKGFGTLTEIGYALRAGKPIISMGSWEVDPAVCRAESPEAAVDTITRLVKSRTVAAAPPP